MPLIYSFVARGSTILAEYTPYTGNFNVVALECLQKLNNPESKFTIACDRHTFNYLIHNGFTYLVVADEAYGRQVPFAFLDRVKHEFEEEYAEKGRVSMEHALDRSFGPRLKSHMEYCMSHPDEISKITQVQRKVNEVKDVMVENIEKVLERGERIELLVDKTDVLRNQAEVFQKKGKALRNKMWWNYCKWKLLIVACLIILAIVIFLIACFAGGRDCTQQDVRSRIDAEVFQKKGKSLRNKMWWNYCKWKLLVIGCLIILAIVIFLIACFAGGRDCTQQDVRSKVQVNENNKNESGGGDSGGGGGDAGAEHRA